MTAAARHASYFGPLLVVVGLMCQEVGAALAVSLFPQVGPVGMVTLRLVFSAIILMLIARAGLRGHSGKTWLVITGFGLVLAAMNVCFYLAIERLDLGVAVTIELLGPLVLSVIVGRRLLSLLWALLALGGIVVLSGTAHDLDWVGVAFAVAAAALWAGYILLAQAAGDRVPGLGALAIATAIGAVGTALLAALVAPIAGMLDPVVLVVGLGIALLSSTIPYALEITALRRISAATFAVLLSLAPAIATLAGFVALGQSLTPWQLIGMVLVIAASIGAVRTSPPRQSAEAAAVTEISLTTTGSLPIATDDHRAGSDGAGREDAGR